MAYFNYFIKCVIRKFVNIIFKPKMFLVLLIIIGLLFSMQISSKAEWTDDNIQRVIEDLEGILDTTYYSYQQLLEIKTNVDGLPTRLEWINQELVTIRDNISILANTTKNIYTEISAITSQLTTLNTEILNIYNSLEENQKELLTELEKDNQAVLAELNMIRDAINGSEEEITDYIDNGIINTSVSSNNNVMALKSISLNYESRYTYTIKVHYRNPYSGIMKIGVWATNNLLPNNYNSNEYVDYFKVLGSVPANTTDFVLDYTVPSNNPKYIYFNWGAYVSKIEVFRSIRGIADSLNQSNDLQQEQNQLQQQQNQLQQEQNDFLKDDNVGVDSSTLPSDTTENITSDGFNSIFQQLYTTFTSGAAQDVVITIPFTNKSFTINAKSVYGGANLGFIKTIIEAFWYFVISYFIVQDIGKKINKIKSGDIEHVQETNIKEDIL